MGTIRFDIFVKEASRQMLRKEHPEGRADWVKVMNFVAWNSSFFNCEEICLAIVRRNDVPLSEREIREIADFQTYEKATRQLQVQEKAVAMLGDEAMRTVDEFFGDGFERELKLNPAIADAGSREEEERELVDGTLS